MTAIKPPTFSDLEERIEAALVVAYQFNDIDGGHHKQWVIDQMVRALLGTPEEYDEFVATFANAEGIEWDEGVAP